jgi:YbbR domain-containing protein
MARWLWNNKGSLLLAFILSLTVWVAAVNEDDPTIEGPLDQPVPIEYLPPKEGLQIVGQLTERADVTIRAPRSVWERITSESIRIQVDLAAYEAGVHPIRLEPESSLNPLKIVEIDPPQISVQLEPLLTKEIPIEISLVGDPAISYDVGEPAATPDRAKVLGPSSSVTKVVSLLAEVDISGARQDIEKETELLALDADGQPVEGIEIDPTAVVITVPIEQSDRSRLVSVFPNLTGTPAYGYRITEILVFPELVQVTTSDPQAIESLPGFVKTEPIDLTDASDTVERRAFLELPQGFTVVGNQTVLVKVTIQPIETSITLDLPIEVQGLDPEFAATLTPDTVTVILTGPLAILEDLQPEDVRVVVNLLNLEEGTHTVTPDVIVQEIEITTETLPPTVDVSIAPAPPETPTPAP